LRRGALFVPNGDDCESLPLVRHAVELDPHFAIAYAQLGVTYNNLLQFSLAKDNLTRAYQLRDRASQREQYYIATQYYSVVTGEIDKANERYELWIEQYPREPLAHLNLGNNYNQLGQFERGATEYEEALHLDPNDAITYANLAMSNIVQNRLNETQSTIDQALQRKLDFYGLHVVLYQLAFLRSDLTGMRQQLAWSIGKPDGEDFILASQADTEAYFGRLTQARQFSRQAADSARRNGKPEAADFWMVTEALREAIYGNASPARKAATAILAQTRSPDLKIRIAWALAASDAITQAQTLVSDLEREPPYNTIVQHCRIPLIRASIALSEGKGANAVELLESAVPYELGDGLDPAYIRGEAYLTIHQGHAAITEFEKILEHRSSVFPLCREGST
jgi:Tfp pilus assembly protein PilF